MKILWITNTIFPDPSKAIGLPVPVTGGWMYGLAMQLANQNNINMAVASFYGDGKFRKDEIEGITYYTLFYKETKRYPKKLESFWKMVCDDFSPDIVHIHGTEYPRGLACMRACSSYKYIVSIQGMPGPISRYYYSDISLGEILRNITFRDILRLDTIIQSKRKCFFNGSFEKEYLKRSSTVIGRTSWDNVHVKVLSEKANYAFCNESLRDELYNSKKWDFDHKRKHLVFLSQAGSPIKGLHKLLEAVSLLKNEFPNISIRIAGGNIIANKTIKDKLRLSGYGKYIRSLLKKYDLFQHIEFLGLLNADLMIKEYQSANVFICPSSIENSPNSVGEAQLIGTPVIASYVGGIPDMVTHGETGLLYRFEEVEMLAANIRKVFNDDELAMRLSKNGIIAAEKRHDREANMKRLIDIYQTVLKNN